MLPSALRGHGCHGAFEDLQQRLLHALAGDVAGDRWVLRLAGDLVDLIDVDDPALCLREIEVRGLQQLEQDILHILADIPGLGEAGGVGDSKWHIEHPCE